jgi:predicted DNA-binding transcriptional regulator YafY
MARYERVSQLYDLLSASREPLSLASLGESLEASSATVKRLVRFLRDELGVEVHFDREQGGYLLNRTARPTKAVLGPAYDSQELSALLSAHEILAQIPPGLFRRETQGLRSRLQQLLYKRPTGHAGIRDRVRLVLPQRRSVDETRFEEVLKALSARMRLQLRYRSRSKDEDTERVVSPVRLTFYRSNWYLAAWCHLTQGLRIFSLDRVAESRITPIPAHELPEKTIDEHLSSAYGIFEGKATHTAHLRFTPTAARWIADEEWHPDQRLEHRADGGVDLHVPYYRTTELKMDLMRLGAEVEVLAPQALRDQIAEAHRHAAKRYRKR